MFKTSKTSVIIIGAGLAGLTNALYLAQSGLDVVLFEKETFPRHKVCGEYISNEVLPFLQELRVDPFALGATKISRCSISSIKGREVEAPLPLGGFGISRFRLDDHLQQCCQEVGVRLITDSVKQIQYVGNHFRVQTQTKEIWEAGLVIGAYGKRSRLDKEQARSFIQQRAPYLAVKRHFAGDFPDDLVALHNFKGGYCGVSKVEEGRINVCYLADYAAFKQYKNIERFEQEVVYKNPHLSHCFQTFQSLFEAPLTISQVSFAEKERVHEHVLMSGDSAGMIHPLCGNGMGMAIGSAQLLSALVLRYLGGEFSSRSELEVSYKQQWQQQYRKRLLAGRAFSALFARNNMFDHAVSILTRVPVVLPFFIRQTHGVR